jgi:ribonuclease-3
VLGAVYLDGGMDAARAVVVRLFGDRIQAAIDAGGRNQDHKSRLQEELATRTDAPAVYSFEATGPDHARHFTVTVRADGRQLGVGLGRSKKQAEQEAARAALVELGSAAEQADTAETDNAPGGADDG